MGHGRLDVRELRIVPGSGVLVFVFAWRRGLMRDVEMAKYPILDIIEPDFYEPNGATDESEHNESHRGGPGELMMYADKPPSGSDGETVRAYYDHLFSTYLDRMHQNFSVRPGTFLLIGLFIVVIGGSIAIVAGAQQSSTRSDSPTPVETYDGYISETNAESPPLLVAFVGVALWCFVLTRSPYARPGVLMADDVHSFDGPHTSSMASSDSRPGTRRTSRCSRSKHSFRASRRTGDGGVRTSGERPRSRGPGTDRLGTPRVVVAWTERGITPDGILPPPSPRRAWC